MIFSQMCCHIPSLITSTAESVDSLLSSYNTTLSSLLDKHAPVITKFSKRTSKSSPWFTSTLHALRSTVRRAENLYKRTHTALSWSYFKSLRNRYNNLILTSKKQYCCNLIFSVNDNPRRLWQTVYKLLCRKPASPLPTSTSFTSLADSFASFFTDEISKLRLSLGVLSTTMSPHSPAPSTTPPSFSTFKPATESEVSKILLNFPNRQSDSDPTAAKSVQMRTITKCYRVQSSITK